MQTGMVRREEERERSKDVIQGLLECSETKSALLWKEVREYQEVSEGKDIEISKLRRENVDLSSINYKCNRDVVELQNLNKKIEETNSGLNSELEKIQESTSDLQNQLQSLKDDLVRQTSLTSCIKVTN